jgi:hypothetical protein
MFARVIAAALLSLFSASLALPLIAPDLRPALPACCRRDGKHHCAMMDMALGDDGEEHFLPSRCPSYPTHSVTAHFEEVSTAPPVQAFVSYLPAAPAPNAQGEVLYRISHHRSRQERGPPSLS